MESSLHVATARATRALAFLLLGLLPCCQKPAIVSTATPVVGAPAATATPLQPPTTNEKPEPPPPPPALILDEISWRRGSLLRGPGVTSTRSPTHGGFASLNLIADELAILARECQCTGEPVSLAVYDEAAGWQLLAVLGLLELAGFTQVAVAHRQQLVTFELGDPAPPRSGPTLRILARGVELAGAPPGSPTVDVAQLCREATCEGATLSVAEEAGLETWWASAVAVAVTDEHQPVHVRLDSLPRRPLPRQDRGGVMQPTGRIAADELRQRIFAEYAPLYACLAQFPAAPGSTQQAYFELSIAADGTTKNVDVIGAGAPTETIMCLRAAFHGMVFRAPNLGSAKVKYPFALSD